MAAQLETRGVLGPGRLVGGGGAVARPQARQHCGAAHQGEEHQHALQQGVTEGFMQMRKNAKFNSRRTQQKIEI